MQNEFPWRSGLIANRHIFKVLPSGILCTIIMVTLCGAIHRQPILAKDLPSDRQALDENTGHTGEAFQLELHSFDEEQHPEVRPWASVHKNTLVREAHLRKVAGAYGLAATMTSLSLSALLIEYTRAESDRQTDFWKYTAIATGSLAGVAFVSGTILWFRTPAAPGQSGRGSALGLNIRIDY